MKLIYSFILLTSFIISGCYYAAAEIGAAGARSALEWMTESNELMSMEFKFRNNVIKVTSYRNGNRILIRYNDKKEKLGDNITLEKGSYDSNIPIKEIVIKEYSKRGIILEQEPEPKNAKGKEKLRL